MTSEPGLEDPQIALGLAQGTSLSKPVLDSFPSPIVDLVN